MTTLDIKADEKRTSGKNIKPVGKVARRARRAAAPISTLNFSKPGKELLPLQVTQGRQPIDLMHWLEHNEETWQQQLVEHGAILFRGFDVDTSEKVEQFAGLVINKIFKDNTEHQPVSDSGAVQVPVDYSKQKFLLWHNENTFNYEWPQRAIFACAIPAEQGGETPLVDSRLIYRDLDPDIRQQFIDKGVMYVRNYGTDDFVGLSWKKVFNTDDKAEVERMCHEQKMTFEWLDNGHLITRAKRPAVWQHPVSGDWSWVNQAQHFHFSCLPKETQETLKELHNDSKDYPRHCLFGDGSEIPAEVMTQILALYEKHQVVFPWHKGDVALVDNILAAHARNPYQGERKIFVCFGDLTSF